MKVFVTGATGWIGSPTVTELVHAGHHVTGLVRSDASADKLRSIGADPVAGDLDDVETLRRESEKSDAVVHLANRHDWSDMKATNRSERNAVEAIAEALKGSGRPFAFACGVAGLTPGRAATEDDSNPSTGPDSPRGGAENLALTYVDQDVRVLPIRFAPSVHGIGDHGFVRSIVDAARRTGVSGYVGDGAAKWSAVHVSDAARLVRLALENAPSGTKVHAVAEESVPTTAIAHAIGEYFNLPVQSIPADDAVDHFGFIGNFFALNLEATRQNSIGIAMDSEWPDTSRRHRRWWLRVRRS